MVEGVIQNEITRFTSQGKPVDIKGTILYLRNKHGVSIKSENLINRCKDRKADYF